jgi:hypothetical protein
MLKASPLRARNESFVRRSSWNRGGSTLVELVVSLTLTGLVLAMVSAVSLRQQRLLDDLMDRRASTARLREASSILPTQLRALSPFDIREARDTSLEVRGTIATAVVCDTANAMLVLAPAAKRDARYASFLSPIEAGDTVWALENGITDRWRPSAITATGSRASGTCGATGPMLSGDALTASRITIAVADPSIARIGTVLRMTRPVRYSLYRGSDGGWYVGERDWNNTTTHFNPIQPVIGPLLGPGKGMAFRYSDSSGASITIPVAPSALATIVMIQVDLRSQTRRVVRDFGVRGDTGRRVDSTVLMVALRNRS